MSADMTDSRREAFRTILRETGLSVNAWARRAGLSEGTLRGFLQGQTRSLREETAQKLLEAASEYAREHGLEIAQLEGGQERKHTDRVWVRGLVGAGAVVQILDGMNTSEGLYEIELPSWLPPNRRYVAYEIRGFAMPPAQDRWIIFCETGHTGDIAGMIGRACVVELEDGRRLFRVIRRGYAADLFNLESWDGAPLIEDVAIVSAQAFAGLADPQTLKG